MRTFLIRFLTIAGTLAASLWIVEQTPEASLAWPQTPQIQSWLEQTGWLARLLEGQVLGSSVNPRWNGQVGDPEIPAAPAQVIEDVPELDLPASSASVSIPFLIRGSGSASTNSNPGPAAGDGIEGGLSPNPPRSGGLEIPTIPMPEQRPSNIEEPAEIPRQAPAVLPPGEQLVQTGRDVRTLLLMGSDKRDWDSTWRTDVIMVAVMDMQLGKVDVISIPRDLFIEFVPEHGPNKINTFDYWGEQEAEGGGPALMGRIIHDYFGIPIDSYARAQFSGFVEIVDALGGIEIDVACPLYDVIPEENIYLSLMPGRHHLDGEQALAYVRSRAQGGDLSRVERQQQVLLAMRDQFTLRNLAPQIPSLYVALNKSVETDIGLLEAVNLARFAYNIRLDDVQILTLGPPEHMETGWAYGMQVWLPKWEDIRQDIQTLIGRAAGENADIPAADAQVNAAAQDQCQ